MTDDRQVVELLERAPLAIATGPDARGGNQGGGLVRAPDAGRSFNVAALTIRRWIEQRIIGGTQLGARWYVYESHFRLMCDRLDLDPDRELKKHERARRTEKARRARGRRRK